MNKYNLIEEFFSNHEDAIKFFVQLKELRIASIDGNSIAILQKSAGDKWTYQLDWMDGKFIGEHLKPFKPSIENIKKFNNGCKEIAKLFEVYIDTGDITIIENNPSPFGDMVYEGP